MQMQSRVQLKPKAKMKLKPPSARNRAAGGVALNRVLQSAEHQAPQKELRAQPYPQEA